jgi:hypothetical protein
MLFAPLATLSPMTGSFSPIMPRLRIAPEAPRMMLANISEMLLPIFAMIGRPSVPSSSMPLPTSPNTAARYPDQR